MVREEIPISISTRLQILEEEFAASYEKLEYSLEELENWARKHLAEATESAHHQSDADRQVLERAAINDLKAAWKVVEARERQFAEATEPWNAQFQAQVREIKWLRAQVQREIKEAKSLQQQVESLQQRGREEQEVRRQEILGLIGEVDLRQHELQEIIQLQLTNRQGLEEFQKSLGARQTQLDQFARELDARQQSLSPYRDPRDVVSIVASEKDGRTDKACRYDQSDKPLAQTSHLPDTHAPRPSHGDEMRGNDKNITIRGVRYLPLSLAASIAQTNPSTLREWINNRTKFEGRLIKTHTPKYVLPGSVTPSRIAGQLHISEESVQRIAARFVKWPSNEPTGPITIGSTDDQKGFLGLPDAAKLIAVDHHTMWLWAAQGKAPTDKCLDVIKCKTSNRFYIRERDVLALKAFVPRTGLRRGRRTQPAPRP